MTTLSSHTKGLLLTGLGVLAISPDGLLTRLISADTLEITYWRGLYFGYGVLVLLLLRFGRGTLQLLFSIGWPGVVLMLLYALGNLCFIYSLTHTAVANTLLIISTTPLFAAIIAWFFLRERVASATWVAIGLVTSGIVIICAEKGGMRGSFYGNMAGLVAACSLAAGFCVVRKYKQTELLPAFGLGGFLVALLISPWVDPVQTSAQDHGYLFVMGFLMLPIANMLMFLGPKYLPAPEVGLMMLLESILGPLWVWLVLDERLSAYTLFGGAVIVLTLALHAGLKMRPSAAGVHPLRR